MVLRKSTCYLDNQMPFTGTLENNNNNNNKTQLLTTNY